MKVVMLTKLRKPLVTSEKGVPDPPAKDEVSIRVEASGVCYRDILIAGGFFPRVKLPIVLGHEVAGSVSAVGAEVREFDVGDAVCALPYSFDGSCRSCTTGAENICRDRRWLGEDVDGAYAEYVSVKSGSLVAVPRGVRSDDAAVSTCVLGTLVHCMTRQVRVSSGQKVLVTGATGAVGSNAVLLARALGATVIAAVGESKLRLAERLGADEVVESGEGLSGRVKEITDGAGVDVALEVVGTPTIEQSLKSLRWGGKLIVIGNVTPDRAAQVPLGPIILRENAIIGCANGTKADLLHALRLVQRGDLRPNIGAVLPLDKAEYAHQLVRRRRSSGKVILRP